MSGTAYTKIYLNNWGETNLPSFFVLNYFNPDWNRLIAWIRGNGLQPPAHIGDISNNYTKIYLDPWSETNLPSFFVLNYFNPDWNRLIAWIRGNGTQPPELVDPKIFFKQEGAVTEYKVASGVKLAAVKLTFQESVTISDPENQPLRPQWTTGASTAPIQNPATNSVFMFSDAENGLTSTDFATLLTQSSTTNTLVNVDSCVDSQNGPSIEDMAANTISVM